jgi:hypothetical protein
VSEPIKPMSKEDMEYYRQYTDTPYYTINGVALASLITTIDDRDKRIAELELMNERFQFDIKENNGTINIKNRLIDRLITTIFELNKKIDQLYSELTTDSKPHTLDR